MERAMDGGDEGDTFSFSVASPTTTTPTAPGVRRRGGAAAGRGAGKTRAAGGRGRGAAAAAGGTTGRGRGRGGATRGAAAAAAAAPAADDDGGAATPSALSSSGSSSGATRRDAATGASGESGSVGEGNGDTGGDDVNSWERNGTWDRPEQVQQVKEAMVAEVFQDLVDDLLREVVFEMHRKAKMGLMCFNCEDHYPSGIVDKNGYDIFGQAVSGKIVTGEVRFDCLNCGRTVVASRYAPHLEKCMGIGRIARNSSRIASRRMKALDDDVYTPNPSLYMASPSFDDDDDEDDDDATYGEHGKHRTLHMLKEEVPAGEESHVAMSPPDEHNGAPRAGGPTAKQHLTKRTAGAFAGVSGQAGPASVGVARARGGVRKQPPKKKGRTAASDSAESALISFGGDDDALDELVDDGDVVEEMDAGLAGMGSASDGGHLYDMRGAEEHIEADGMGDVEEKTTAKRKGKLAGRGRGHGGPK